jgi:hypothetical protein
MSNLVSGYSGIIAPPNLVANPNFNIHQRTKFSSTFEPLSNLEYVADMWQPQVMTLDYVECWNQGGGALRLQGYGKKGQLIQLWNREIVTPSWGLLDIGAGNNTLVPWTANLQVSGHTGVPVTVGCAPQINTSYQTDIYHKRPTIKDNGNYESTRVMMSSGGANCNQPLLFDITLEEDGEFSIIVTGCNQFVGKFKHPPKYAPVPYADDLARCQRYYQTGEYRLSALGGNDSTYTYIGGSQPFYIPMASAPTVTESNVVIGEVSTDTNELGSYTSLTGITDNSIVFVYRKPNGGNAPRNLNVDWTAEVV